MASGLLARAARASAITAPLRVTNMATPRRALQTTSRLMDTSAGALPVKKPVGAFRAGLTGFLLGSTISGAGMYYYVLEEYRVANELLTEDIYNLQATLQRIEGYMRVLEDKVAAMEKKN
ncbi:hypothetical protein EJ06DRAFT_530650 [Trichodelitschia bisporula]|uniref:Uncharacterized protein n=1 Tax=Trichodelitschia bisporula TaxID=703511 RepID=A0A6G1HUW9_9PEZI|nr:hypothetical protein EJ06DRAFT_530650 [Trichodelitschia bisporula]